MPALEAIHDVDPKRALMKLVGKQLKETELFGNTILVAVYKRPEKARYGTLELSLTDNTRKEDEYQGKVGLVVALGPRAYQDDENYNFHGQKVEIGDWVVFRPSEGWAITLTKHQVLCRMLGEENIRMKIPSPDAVW
jgi:co-chaperonin GroES (HSP10)